MGYNTSGVHPKTVLYPKLSYNEPSSRGSNIWPGFLEIGKRSGNIYVYLSLSEWFYLPFWKGSTLKERVFIRPFSEVRWGVGLCRKANQIIRKVAFVVKMVENLASKSSALIVSFTNCLSFLTLLTADLHAFILPCKYFLATLQGFWQIFIKHSTTAFFFTDMKCILFRQLCTGYKCASYGVRIHFQCRQLCQNGFTFPSERGLL